jgi:polygalacturonase
MIKLYLIAIFLSIFCETVTSQASKWINIVEVGGVADGKSILTNAMKDALKRIDQQGGGTIYFPPGEYLSGPIHMKSNTTLYIDAGAVLRFSDNFDDYLPYVEMRWEGTVMKSFSPLIYANKAENITITGRGTIDGQGAKWWAETLRNVDEIRKTGNVLCENKWQKMWVNENVGLQVAENYSGTIKRKFFRPPFIQTFQCSNVRIEGITIRNSPFWTVNPEFCDNVTVSGVTIRNPESPNTDGINPESCKNVHISDCHISVGDDCITLKSGRDEDGRKYNVPCENITITNCTMLNGHGGVVIGSEMSGGVKNVVITNCIFDGTDRGIRLKTTRGRGGVVENIRVSNILMKDIKVEAIVLNMFYGESIEGPVSVETPCFRNIHLANITGVNINKACKVDGLPEMPVSEISFSNINMEAQTGFEINGLSNIQLNDISVAVQKGPVVFASNVKGLIMNNIRSPKAIVNSPVIEIFNTREVYIQACYPAGGTDLFLRVNGLKSGRIVLQGNCMDNVKQEISYGVEFDKSLLSVIR